MNGIHRWCVSALPVVGSRQHAPSLTALTAPNRIRPARRRFGATIAAFSFAALIFHTQGSAVRAAESADGKPLGSILASVAKTPLEKAPFFASKTSGLLSTPIESRGTLSFDPQGRIEKHTLTPIDERVTITDKAVRIEQAGKPADEILVADNPALATYAQGLRAVLAGDPAPLREHFDVKVDGDVGKWTIALEPKSLKMQAGVRRIVIAGSNGLIQRIETTDGAGDVETLSVLLKPPPSR